MIACCSRLVRIAACVAIVTSTGTASAQTDTTVTAATTTPTRSLCWRPRPAPVCRAYVPTEFAYEHPVASTWVELGQSGLREDDFGRRFVLALGLMRNRGSSTALGGLVAISTDDPEVFGLLRAEGRYRRWVGSGAGIDVGLGLAQKSVYSDPCCDYVRARGLTAGIGFDLGYVGVDARIDRLRGGGRSQNGAFVGVHAGSQAAPAAAGALVTVWAIAVIAYLSGA